MTGPKPLGIITIIINKYELFLPFCEEEFFCP